ncbi:hypothetical protein [Pseudodesulfovibrio sp.]|uniref:hypothetical protein n=1 Tax=unclassified Pseudodesulfovibrio TaxID=2661612 RepID=UPI003B0080F7
MSNHKRLVAIGFMESITPEIVYGRFERGFDFFPGFHAVSADKPMNGHGAGWVFHTPACFCEALDVKITLKLTEEEKKINKTLPPEKKIKPKPYWTQGSEFNFTEGCLVYDTQLPASLVLSGDPL